MGKGLRSAGICTAAVVAALVLPAAAGATVTTIGEIAPPGAPQSSCGLCVEFQRSDDPFQRYSVPAGNWTLTSWSVRAHQSIRSPVSLVIFRPTGTPNQFTLVAKTPEAIAEAGTVPSCAAAIPVLPNDTLGIRLRGPMNAAYTDTDGTSAIVTGDPAVGQTVGPPGSNYGFGYNGPLHTNVQATLDSSPPPPDTTPPETAFTRKPGKQLRKRGFKFEFTSSEACSSFKCKIDKKPVEACTPPITRYFGRRGFGRHKVKVFAVDPFGNADPTPAKSRFTLVPKR